MDGWKISTCVLLVVVGCLIYNLSMNPNVETNSILEIDGFEISQENLNSITEVINSTELYKICDIGTSQCIIIQNIKGGKKE